MSPKVFESLEEVRLPDNVPVVLTIGTFDGVHMAHQALIAEALERAAALGGIAAVLTFRNHPRDIVAPELAPALLTAWPEKRRLILGYGAHMLTGLLFDLNLAQTPAEEFVRQVIHDRFHARVVLSGPNFHFGHRAEGNPALLALLGDELGFEFHCRLPMMYGGEKISSTRIRGALVRGDVAEAAALLTRPHFNEGPVVSGDRLGRTIGFPTANLAIPKAFLVPADGVYAVRATLPHGETFGGMMNIGWRPTVGGRDRRYEVHLLDFPGGELQGQRIRVHYVARLRDEQKFSGLEALKAQLALDRESAAKALRLAP